MSKAYDFLRECKIFFVSTIKGDFPAMRPFGVVMESDGKLYISTSNSKEVYNQIKVNSNIQIVSIKSGTREWIRITGFAIETMDLSKKAEMLDNCPNLKTRFSVDSPDYVLFEVTVIETEQFS